METLAIAEALEQAGIEREKAYPIAETINGKSGLTTKEDISEVKSDIVWIKWILGIITSLTVAGMLFLYTRMDRLDQKMDRNYKELNQKMDANHKEVNQRIDRLDQKIDGIKDLIIQEMRK